PIVSNGVSGKSSIPAATKTTLIKKTIHEPAWNIAASLLAVAIGGSLEGKTLAGKIGSGLYGLMDVT
ncbi:hypothetical protein, partial [Enterococcus innesii]|uniref:hypothetical protein n=1 Tax=Enterococcus innesii TaxID=2839759 RepID=UPI0034A4187F